MRHTVATDIELSPALLEWEAAHAAGVDLWKWDNGEYGSQFQAKVIAWYTRHKELELHRQDAVQRAMEQQQRKRGR